MTTPTTILVMTTPTILVITTPTTILVMTTPTTTNHATWVGMIIVGKLGLGNKQQM
jgi:hypothetical protein